MTADALVRRWFDEVWNQGREETIDELLSDDAEIFGLGETEQTVRGPAGFKPFWRILRTAFPDLHIRIEETVDGGNKACAQVVLEATHTGEGLGVAPTGRKVRVAGMVAAEASGGKIVKGWNTWDQLGLLRQIGALESSGTDRFLTTTTK
jgi:steroid delta-isomerase-like uncharacterized protein